MADYPPQDATFSGSSHTRGIRSSKKSTTILLGVLLAVGTARADISTLLRGGYSNNNILQDDGYHYDKPKVPFEEPTTPRKCAVTDQNPDGSCGYDYPKPDQSFTLPNEYLPPTTTDDNDHSSYDNHYAKNDNNHSPNYNDHSPDYTRAGISPTEHYSTDDYNDQTYDYDYASNNDDHASNDYYTPNDYTARRNHNQVSANPDGSCGYDYPKPDQSFTLPNRVSTTMTTTRRPTTVNKNK
uniref:Uncharacterized protein n=1 Tax=Anopheles epiroticus TaxID=199890 RepID=A0A182PB93_9DIPT